MKNFMKQFDTFKVYGKAKKIGINYYEVPYTEYYVDGTKRCIGTEDFTSERLRSQTKTFSVYCYNGEILHGAYREGYKRTDCVGTLRVSKNACKIAVARMIYGDNVSYVK